PSLIAASMLVTPESADTTTSTRRPAARSRARRPMVSQRARCETEVPPNFSTIQRLDPGLEGMGGPVGRKRAGPAILAPRGPPGAGAATLARPTMDPAMPACPSVQLDVFGDRPGAGNPLAVIPDARGLNDADMQAIARWTRLPETTFVFPSPTASADYAVRIFSPRREVPFAGHPSVGTAHVLLDRQLVAPRDGL